METTQDFIPATAAAVARYRLFPWVQGLRAVAALAVAFYHLAHEATSQGFDPNGWIAAAAGCMPWSAGVDIFFVISGFVIVHASSRLFAQPGGGRLFLRRRLSRIVPLYWGLTTLFLATLLTSASSIHGAIGGPAYLLATYLFVPWPRPDGLVEPALGVGWTLNYEMFFYLLLTPFLRLPRSLAVGGCAAVLIVLVAAGQVIGFRAAPLSFWANPIVLEFVFGMAIALAVDHGLTLPGWIRAALIAAAIVVLHQQAHYQGRWDAIAFGLPGAMLVLAAASARRAPPISRSMNVMVRLGDASYATYLFHPFVMRALSILAVRLIAPSESGGLAMIVIGLLVIQVCAVQINQRLERPVLATLRRRFG